MRYDFDLHIDRGSTGSVKWGFIQDGGGLTPREEWEARYGVSGLLSMWVADMDFPAPEPVIEALSRRVKHGVFGYTAPRPSYFESVKGWMKRRHNWEISAEWICPSPGVVPSLNLLVRAFCARGKKVVVQTPVYYPFFSAVSNNGNKLVKNSLSYEGGRYRMDYDDLQAKVKDPDVEMIILCNPHNPVGRVWSREELVKFGETCIRNDVLIIADEIHGDLIFGGSRFVPFAGISDEFAQASIVCTAPSKTFNLAGLQTSNIIIADETRRSGFLEIMKKNGLFGLNVFGAEALEAAYAHGEEWLVQVLRYIEGNYSYLLEYFRNYLPDIKPVPLEGTYLVWLDCRGLGLSREELSSLMLRKAGVNLDDGYIFGSEGEGFERINIACPRSILSEALDRIRDALNGKHLDD